MLGNTLAVRGVAAVLIVLVHENLVLRPGLEQWWPAGFWGAPVFAIPVPLFFLLAGYASRIDCKYNHSLWRRLRRIVTPFLVWNSGFLLLDRGVHFESVWWIVSLFTGYWHLYFLFALIQLHVLQHFLLRSRITLRSRHLVVATAAMAVLFSIAAEFVLWTRGAFVQLFENELNRTIFPWAMFYCGGMFLRDEPKWFESIAGRRVLLAVIVCVSHLLYATEFRTEDAWLGYNPLQQFLLSGLLYKTAAVLLILSLMVRRAGPTRIPAFRRILVSCGRESYGIYLSHLPILVLILGLYDQAEFNIPFSLEPPALWLLALIAAWGLVKLVRWMPWIWPGQLLFGIRRTT